MPRNASFSLKKIVKIARVWGLRPQTLLASGGSGLRLQSPNINHLALWILLFMHLPMHAQRLFRNRPKTLCSCDYSGSAPGFRGRKNFTAFHMPQTTEIITLGFNFLFRLTHSFCAGAVLYIWMPRGYYRQT